MDEIPAPILDPGRAPAKRRCFWAAAAHNRAMAAPVRQTCCSDMRRDAAAPTPRRSDAFGCESDFQVPASGANLARIGGDGSPTWETHTKTPGDVKCFQLAPSLLSA